MKVISQEFQIKDKIESMLAMGHENQFNSVNPIFEKVSRDSGELLSILARKRAVKDEKQYKRIRRSFEQNKEKQSLNQQV